MSKLSQSDHIPFLSVLALSALVVAPGCGDDDAQAIPSTATSDAAADAAMNEPADNESDDEASSEGNTSSMHMAPDSAEHDADLTHDAGFTHVDSSDADKGDGGKDGGTSWPDAGSDSGSLNAEVYAVTDEARLVAFNRSNPGEFVAEMDITGLVDDDMIVDVDFRPADGNLYALSWMGNVYTLDTATGEASLVASLGAADGDASDPFEGLDTDATPAIDFNPAADLLRVVTSTGQNLRTVPSARTINGVAQVAGATFTDGILNPGAPRVTAAAYDDNFNLTCRTRLFVIDADTDKLYLQSPPNDGTLVEVGDLGLDVAAVHGFDITTDQTDLHDTALAALTVGDQKHLYSIDLTSGAATSHGALASGLMGFSLRTPDSTSAPVQSRGEVLAVTESHKLVSFNRSAPRNLCTSMELTGVVGDAVGIDVRPATGDVYLLSNTSQLYVVDPSNGVAAEQGELTSSLSGTSFGIGFNPVADRLRVVSDTGQNLRIVPPESAEPVTANVDTVLSMNGVSAVAYTNSYAGTTSTALYAIDTATDSLVLIGFDPATAGACEDPLDDGNPNCGVATTVRALGVSGDVTHVNGFDIEASTGVALAAVTIGEATTSTLVSIGLTPEASTSAMGGIGGGERIVGLTLAVDINPN